MKYLKLCFLTVWSVLFSIGTLQAQLNVDSRAVYDRMDRLERDIALMQRKLYKGEGEDKTSSEQENTSDGSLQHLYIKISQLEELMAQMTSQFEEVSHQLEKLQEDMKKMNTDVDFRFSELQKTEPVTPSAPEPQEPKKEKPKDAQTAYEEAYDLLKMLKYDQAEDALKDFLTTYPEHELAGNAQYWLGETYYVRRQYEKAAVAFATGFKNYKRSSKRADNLLKLGLSMQQLNKKKEACTAFNNLKKEFPDASELILSRAQKESKELGCGK